MRSKISIAAAAAVFASGTASAVPLADLGLTLEQIHQLNAQLTAPAATPGIAFGSPIAFGAESGQAFAGIGGVTEQALPHDVDGSAILGFGLGNAAEGLGLELSTSIISIFTDPGDAGAFNAKVHRALPGHAAIAFGVEQFGGWGDADDIDASVYAAYTQVFELAPGNPRNPLSFSINLGVGTERFVDFTDDGLGVFGGFSFHPHRQVSLIADWTGRDANAALSLAPLRDYPVVITLGAVNLAERLNRDVEFAGGIGYLWQF